MRVRRSAILDHLLITVAEASEQCANCSKLGALKFPQIVTLLLGCAAKINEKLGSHHLWLFDKQHKDRD